MSASESAVAGSTGNTPEVALRAKWRLKQSSLRTHTGPCPDGRCFLKSMSASGSLPAESLPPLALPPVALPSLGLPPLAVSWGAAPPPPMNGAIAMLFLCAAAAGHAMVCDNAQRRPSMTPSGIRQNREGPGKPLAGKWLLETGLPRKRTHALSSVCGIARGNIGWMSAKPPTSSVWELPGMHWALFHRPAWLFRAGPQVLTS